MERGKLLIINADDLGFNNETDQQILNAWQKKLVSSTSIMATGESFERAAELANEQKIPTGLHLSISAGKPFRNNSSLSNGDRFLLQDNSEAITEIKTYHVYDELKAQIDFASEKLQKINQVDVHQHFLYLRPDLVNVFLKLANEYSLKIRWPFTPTFNFDVIANGIGMSVEILKKLVSQLNELKNEYSQLLHPDEFLGISHTSSAPEKIKDIPNSVYESLEICVHPRGGREGVEEYEFLSSDELRTYRGMYEVVGSFGELV